MKKTSALLLVLALLALPGCGTGTAPVPSAAPTPSVSASPSAAPTPDPSQPPQVEIKCENAAGVTLTPAATLTYTWSYDDGSGQMTGVASDAPSSPQQLYEDKSPLLPVLTDEDADGKIEFVFAEACDHYTVNVYDMASDDTQIALENLQQTDNFMTLPADAGHYVVELAVTYPEGVVYYAFAAEVG